MKKTSGFEKFMSKEKSGAAKKEQFRQEKKKITKERKEFFEQKRKEAKTRFEAPPATGTPSPSGRQRPSTDARVEPSSMPLNKYIAHSGVSSRRDAADIVKSGKVKVKVVPWPG